VARPGVTRMLLWQEYKNAEPLGWQYSVFCDQYTRWRGRQDVVLRQNHAPGEEVFLDYAGQTVAIVDRCSGESSPAQIFVAVLGCSNYTYICATRTQSLVDRLAAQVQMLEFFGGVRAALRDLEYTVYGISTPTDAIQLHVCLESFAYCLSALPIVVLAKSMTQQSFYVPGKKGRWKSNGRG
jgi:hypothetical protein